MGGIMRHLGYTPSPSETSSNAVTQTKDSILHEVQTNKHTHTLTERNLNWEEEEEEGEEEVSGRRSSYS